MDKKIIVAGAGHGGLIAAAKLAAKGFNVTVYEKNIKENLGYDWQDAIDLKIFGEVGVPVPRLDNISFNGDMRFYNPSMTAPITVESNGNGSAKFERKELYNILINYAEQNGAKIVYDTLITGPAMDGERVVGIETADGCILGDMVIDAAGVNSPVRRGLPFCCNVDRDYAWGETFYAYRAYFNKLPDYEPEVPYEIILAPYGEKGLVWVVTEDDCVDVLIGSFNPKSKAQIKETLEKIREFSPQLGQNMVRGGQQIQIPIRRPLSVMVCDGYAAVGDSAYMTIPMNGSGICASMRAGAMLADTIAADKEYQFSKQTLWSYNRRYMLHIGLNFAAVDMLKNAIMNIEADGVDFIFEKQLITQSDLNFSRQKDSDGITAGDMMGRIRRGFSKTPVFLHLASAISKGDTVKKIYRSIPEEYDENAVLKWKQDILDALVPMTR